MARALKMDAGTELDVQPWQEEVGQGFKGRREPDLEAGLKEPGSTTAKETDMLGAGQRSAPTEERIERMGTARPQPGQAGGLEEKPEMGGLAKLITQPYRKHEAEIKRQELNNQLKEGSQRMKKGMRSLAQGFAAFQAENLDQAVMYVGRAYDEIPDGGKLQGIITPFNRKTRSIANRAGVDKLIMVNQADGNVLYIPLDKQNVERYLTEARAAYNPETFITSWITIQAMIKDHNEDQVNNPTLHEDGTVTYAVIDPKTGGKTTEVLASRKAFTDKHGTPNLGWRAPKGEVQRAEMKRQKFMTSPAGLVDLGGEGEKPGVVPGTEPTELWGEKGLPLSKKEGQERVAKGEKVYPTGIERPGPAKPVYDESGRVIPPEELKTHEGDVYETPVKRTTGKGGPTLYDPSKMVKGRDKAGQEVSGFVVNGQFVPMPNVAKIQSEKGKPTPQSITEMYAEFTKAYDSQFIDKTTNEYAAGKGPEDRKQVVEQAVRQALPRQYWRMPTKWATKPTFSKKHGWVRQDLLGEWWQVSAPTTKKGKKPKATITPAIEPSAKWPTGKGEVHKIPMPTEGIKEPR